VQQGARAAHYGYDASGRLSTIRDALGQATTIEYDRADRESVQTFPDGRKVTFAYDRNGNRTSLTPTGRPAHSFSYTPVDLAGVYTPPVVPGVPSPATTFDWNKDRQPTAIHRPDG